MAWVPKLPQQAEKTACTPELLPEAIREAHILEHVPYDNRAAFVPGLILPPDFADAPRFENDFIAPPPSFENVFITMPYVEPC